MIQRPPAPPLPWPASPRPCRPPPAYAQSNFPQRDITFIVPWNAGGSNDVAARALDPLLREHGIKIVIENVVGATGAIGMRRVASAAPDGYTHRHGHQFDAGADRAGQDAAEECAISPISRGSRPIR